MSENCKHCGGCETCDRCSHCGNCRKCGKSVAPFFYPSPIWLTPYVIPVPPMPYHPFKPMPIGTTITWDTPTHCTVSGRTQLTLTQ